jgi:type I restriction enzyme S subunit
MSEQNGKLLPSQWAEAQLSAISLINPRLDRTIDSDDVAVDFVPMRAVEPEGGGLLRPEITTYGKVKKGYTAFRSGDVIMAKITPCMENGKTCVVPELPGAACFGSTEFHVFRPEQGIDARWISNYLLQHATRYAAQRLMAGGVGQMRVPSAFLESLTLPVAPSAEQSRILDTLDELLSDLDAGVAALERARAKLKQYRSAVLKAAVQGSLTAEWRERHPVVEPASELLDRILAERRRRWEAAQLEKFKSAGKSPPKNWKDKYPQPAPPHTTNLPALPAGWCWATVDQCAGLIQYGTSAKTDSGTDGVPVLRMGNIRTDGTLDLTDLKFLPPTHEEFPALLLESGDLLFNRTNSAELVGKTGHYRGAPSPSSFASYLIRVRMSEGTMPAIVGYALNSSFGRRWVRTVVTQMVGQANVNGTKLASFTFPLAPLAEQSALIEAVEDQLSVIEHLETDLDARLKGSTALRQSILRHAFSGQLVPQDPTDEPASELLKRIATEREKRTRPMQAAKRATTKTKSTTSPRKRAAKTRK